jgi:hypothetical protein
MAQSGFVLTGEAAWMRSSGSASYLWDGRQKQRPGVAPTFPNQNDPSNPPRTRRPDTGRHAGSSTQQSDRADRAHPRRMLRFLLCGNSEPVEAQQPAHGGASNLAERFRASVSVEGRGPPFSSPRSPAPAPRLKTMERTRRKNCSGAKPPAYTVVKLFFPAGAEQAGYWNGTSWVAGGFAVSPKEWQALPKFPKSK